MLTPFSQENISNILSEAKPYRNVIKRYWTEEEVKFVYLKTCSIGR
jgi:hypothetical protein